MFMVPSTKILMCEKCLTLALSCLDSTAAFTQFSNNFVGLWSAFLLCRLTACLWCSKDNACCYYILHSATDLTMPAFFLSLFSQKLAKKLHPDTNKGDADAERKFQEVQRAYEELDVRLLWYVFLPNLKGCDFCGF